MGVDPMRQTIRANCLIVPTVIGHLVREFLLYSMEHGGSEVAAEAKRVADVVSGQNKGFPLLERENPIWMASWLRDQIPESVKEADEPVTVVQHALAAGALIVRHLLEQAGHDEERAQAYLYLFVQDWTKLFQGVPMQRQWISTPKS
jgi:hypothetical protein